MIFTVHFFGQNFHNWWLTFKWAEQNAQNEFPCAIIFVGSEIFFLNQHTEFGDMVQSVTVCYINRSFICKKINNQIACSKTL